MTISFKDKSYAYKIILFAIKNFILIEKRKKMKMTKWVELSWAEQTRPEQYSNGSKRTLKNHREFQVGCQGHLTNSGYHI